MSPQFRRFMYSLCQKKRYFNGSSSKKISIIDPKRKEKNYSNGHVHCSYSYYHCSIPKPDKCRRILNILMFKASWECIQNNCLWTRIAHLISTYIKCHVGRPKHIYHSWSKIRNYWSETVRTYIAVCLGYRPLREFSQISVMFPIEADWTSMCFR